MIQSYGCDIPDDDNTVIRMGIVSNNNTSSLMPGFGIPHINDIYFNIKHNYLLSNQQYNLVFDTRFRKLSIMKNDTELQGQYVILLGDPKYKLAISMATKGCKLCLIDFEMVDNKIR